MSEPNGCIVFRQITRDMPSNWIGGIRWYVEFHDANHDMAYPLGIAFVTDPTPWNGAAVPYLDFVYVVDQKRRCGIASALIRACEKKWSRIALTDAISESGQALLEAVS